MVPRLALLSLLVVPVAALWFGGECALGTRSYDLIGHLWAIWNASQGPDTTTVFQAWPEGLDLLPVLGGWADVRLGGLAVEGGASVERAYNGMLALYLLASGIGGWALARALGAGTGGGLAAGLVLQLDPLVLAQLQGGRSEQVGIGFVALALAGAVHTLRREGWWATVATGAAGAAVVWVSWEYAVMLAATVLVLFPFLVAGERAAGWWARWALALAVALALAGPHTLSFLERALAVRGDGQLEADFALRISTGASIGALGWLQPEQPRPAWGALLGVLALPWMLRDRWLGIGVALVLGLAFVLALGPYPGVWEPGRMEGAPWGPFAWLQELPLLSWYHWPIRLMAAWSVAAAVGVGLVVSRWRVGWLVGLVVVVACGVEAAQLPLHRTCLPKQPHLVTFGEQPTGAVLELPLASGVGPASIEMLERQMRHGHPVVGNALMEHLVDVGEREPWFAWASSLDHHRRGRARVRPPADLDAALPEGLRYVVLLDKGMSPRPWNRTRETLEEAFGPATWRVGTRWLAWDRQAAE